MFAAMNFKRHMSTATATSAAAVASFCALALLDSVILAESIFVVLLPIIVAVVGSKAQP